MAEYKLFLAQLADAGGKWHILDTNRIVLAECDTQAEAMDKISEIMGSPDWKHEKVYDNSVDGTAMAMMEKRGKKVN